MHDLTLSEIKGSGAIAHERVVIRALNATDIGDYVIFAARATPKGTFSGPGFGYWLPDILVEKGDNVVVYTKSGARKEKVLASGKKSYFIYLGLSEPLWHNDEKAAVLFKIFDWERIRASGFADDDDAEPEG
jgi:hypothetical protein